MHAIILLAGFAFVGAALLRGIVKREGFQAAQMESFYSTSTLNGISGSGGEMTFDIVNASQFQIDGVALKTDLIPEGSANLYWTTARGNANFAVNWNSYLDGDHDWSGVSSFGALHVAVIGSDANLLLSPSTYVGSARPFVLTWAGDGTYPHTITATGSINTDTGYRVGGAALTTTNIPEGSHLYYTDARFDTRLALKSTTHLAEGANQYYTDGRFDARLTLKTTADLAGTNLYYTDGRFDTRLA